MLQASNTTIMWIFFMAHKICSYALKAMALLVGGAPAPIESQTARAMPIIKRSAASANSRFLFT
jgi:hypothetical protein